GAAGPRQRRDDLTSRGRYGRAAEVGGDLETVTRGSRAKLDPQRGHGVRRRSREQSFGDESMDIGIRLIAMRVSASAATALFSESQPGAGRPRAARTRVPWDDTIGAKAWEASIPLLGLQRWKTEPKAQQPLENRRDRYSFPAGAPAPPGAGCGRTCFCSSTANPDSATTTGSGFRGFPHSV